MDIESLSPLDALDMDVDEYSDPQPSIEQGSSNDGDYSQFKCVALQNVPYTESTHKLLDQLDGSQYYEVSPEDIIFGQNNSGNPMLHEKSGHQSLINCSITETDDFGYMLQNTDEQQDCTNFGAADDLESIDEKQLLQDPYTEYTGAQYQPIQEGQMMQLLDNNGNLVSADGIEMHITEIKDHSQIPLYVQAYNCEHVQLNTDYTQQSPQYYMQQEKQPESEDYLNILTNSSTLKIQPLQQPESVQQLLDELDTPYEESWKEDDEMMATSGSNYVDSELQQAMQTNFDQFEQVIEPHHQSTEMTKAAISAPEALEYASTIEINKVQVTNKPLALQSENFLPNLSVFNLGEHQTEIKQELPSPCSSVAEPTSVASDIQSVCSDVSGRQANSPIGGTAKRFADHIKEILNLFQSDKGKPMVHEVTTCMLLHDNFCNCGLRMSTAMDFCDQNGQLGALNRKLSDRTFAVKDTKLVGKVWQLIKENKSGNYDTYARAMRATREQNRTYFDYLESGKSSKKRIYCFGDKGMAYQDKMRNWMESQRISWL